MMLQCGKWTSLNEPSCFESIGIKFNCLKGGNIIYAFRIELFSVNLATWSIFRFKEFYSHTHKQAQEQKKKERKEKKAIIQVLLLLLFSLFLFILVFVLFLFFFSLVLYIFQWKQHRDFTTISYYYYYYSCSFSIVRMTNRGNNKNKAYESSEKGTNAQRKNRKINNKKKKV